jgi:hypothetical protein
MWEYQFVELVGYDTLLFQTSHLPITATLKVTACVSFCIDLRKHNLTGLNASCFKLICYVLLFVIHILA